MKNLHVCGFFMLNYMFVGVKGISSRFLDSKFFYFLTCTKHRTTINTAEHLTKQCFKNKETNKQTGIIEEKNF